VIGSYLRSFAGGDISDVASFQLDSVTGDDPKAAKLARVLAFYAERLPADERELLARISVFSRGVALELLSALVEAGGEVAGRLVGAKPRLIKLLESLRERGLVFKYTSNATITWTAHPFLREKFRQLLECPAVKVFDVVAQSLSVGLETRPVTGPSDPRVLDQYERLIEAMRFAGREQEAFDLYWYGMGRGNLWTLGEYERGYRTVLAFSSTGQPEDLGLTLALQKRWLLANALSVYALHLGRLREAALLRQACAKWGNTLGEDGFSEIHIRNSTNLSFLSGRLTEIGSSKAGAETSNELRPLAATFALHAIVAHAIGDIAYAREYFMYAKIRTGGRSLNSVDASFYARHLLDLGDPHSARRCCDEWFSGMLFYDERGAVVVHAVLARIDLAEGTDPTANLYEVRAWTARTGEMQLIIETHLLMALQFFSTGDLQSALAEAENGLLQAISCGYGLLRIELLVALSRIRLAWPDPPRAIQAARQALDLTTDPDCLYAWGEADAAQVWGEAYLANGEPDLARRAFNRALEVRHRIEHPKTAETEQWLARVV
jgi:tetratricopeptide (TPR) repeat protein